MQILQKHASLLFYVHFFVLACILFLFFFQYLVKLQTVFMDIIELQTAIQKDSAPYKGEFLTIANKYAELCLLPQNYDVSLSYLQFLVTTCQHFEETNFVYFLKSQISSCTDFLRRKELIQNWIILKYKKKLADSDFLEIVIKYADLSKLVNKIGHLISKPQNTLGMLFYYANSGNDKQATFCVFVVCYFYEKYGILCCKEFLLDFFAREKKAQDVNNDSEISKKDENRVENNSKDANQENIVKDASLVEEKMFNSNFEKQNQNSHDLYDIYTSKNYFWNPETRYNTKIRSILILYILNELDFCKEPQSRFLQDLTTKQAQLIIKNLSKNLKKEQRPQRIKLLQLITLLKKEKFVKFDIKQNILRMLDPKREDIEVLLELFLQNIENDKEVLAIFIRDFCSEYKDDDIICVGLNFLTRLCYYNRIEDEKNKSVDKSLQIPVKKDLDEKNTVVNKVFSLKRTFTAYISDELKELHKWIIEKVSIYNRSKVQAINCAYRKLFNALRNDIDDVDKMSIVKMGKKCKEERVKTSKENSAIRREEIKQKKLEKRKNLKRKPSKRRKLVVKKKK